MSDVRAGSTAPRGLREDDLLRFTWVADPRISPDGARVAFTRVWVDAEADEYRTQIWVVETAGGAPRALTAGLRDRQPRWSPDGRRLAFVRAAEEGARAQLHVLSMDGGEAQALTALAGGVSHPAWSPDGARLAFLSSTNPALDTPGAAKPKHAPALVVTRPVFRENDTGFIDLDHRDHVWVVETAGGTPRPLTRGPCADGAPAWSRDGARVLFTSDRRDEPWFGHEECQQLWAIAPDLAAPTAGEALEPVTALDGPVRAFAEGPDGAFALVGMPMGEGFHSYRQAGVLLAAGARPVRAPRALALGGEHAFGEGLTSDQHAPRGGGDVPLAFAEDGRAVIAQAARHGGSLLVRVDVATGATRELTPADRDLVHGTATPDGRRWALVIGDPRTPGDLYAFDAATGALTRLWAPNEALLAEVALGDVEALWCDAHDGRRVQAWLVKPPGLDAARAHPLVIEIHGGPHAAYGWSFFHEFHVLAAAGHLVLYVNPRGSTSYGEEFADCIQYAYPGDDARDLTTALEAVVARGGVDTGRLGVTGGSGGGLLTNWIVTRDDRFRAAITQRCVADWAAMWYGCDFTMFEPTWFRRAPFEDPAEYAARSPIDAIERCVTPLMVIHSEEDWRTPIAQGEMMFRALKRLRRPTVMVRFPGESHELSRSGAPSRRVENQRHIRRWFGHWLLDQPAPEYGV